MLNKPPSQVNEPSISIGAAIIAGQIVVNFPVLVIIFGFPFNGLVLFPDISLFIFILIGFVLAWTWWSIMMPRWRIWAHRQGVNPEQLQKWAVITGLAWPKGWIFEKTEFKAEDDE